MKDSSFSGGDLIAKPDQVVPESRENEEKLLWKIALLEAQLNTSVDGILVDEPAVLEVSKAILETLGYTVYDVPDGEQAVSLYVQKKDEIDVVVLDMIMPGLSGNQTFDRIREINPDARVILSSGYSLNDQARQIMEKGCTGFVQKPFDLTQISQKICEALG